MTPKQKKIAIVVGIVAAGVAAYMLWGKKAMAAGAGTSPVVPPPAPRPNVVPSPIPQIPNVGPTPIVPIPELRGGSGLVIPNETPGGYEVIPPVPYVENTDGSGDGGLLGGGPSLPSLPDGLLSFLN